MNTVFPFGFPSPTAFYLVLYVGTLVVHVLFMNYVLAGSAWVALAGFRRGAAAPPATRTISATVRDWLPFALGLTITAGVAPLLFIQILYRFQFYTANLLLLHRWMAMLPVLILGFYLLYLAKVPWPTSRRWRHPLLVTVIAFLCFGFAAWTWTENHLLSIHGELWRPHWEAQSIFHFEAALIPRLAMWCFGAIPTMATLVGWQLWCARHDGPWAPTEPRRAAVAAVTALAAAALCGGCYCVIGGPAILSAITSPMAMPWLCVAAAGVLIQTIAWLDQARRNRFCPRALGAATAGLLFTITGTTVVRESIRLHAIAIHVDSLYERHADSAAVGGFPVFAAFLVLNAIVIAWCVRVAARAAPPAAASR